MREKLVWKGSSEADHLGISQGHLSKMERGKAAPTIETLLILSERFRKSIDWILRGEGN
jgi:transcriptional regulator with XRE-family HTH domain